MNPFLLSIPFLTGLAFLFTPIAAVGAAPGAALAAGLIVWFLSTDSPPRFAVYGGAATGLSICLYRGAFAPLPCLVVPAATLGLIELLGAKSKARRPSPVVILAGVLAAGLAAWSGADSANPFKALGSYSHIAVIGDSLAAGIDIDGAPQKWPEILGGELGAEVVNLSYPGDTASESYRRWMPLVGTGMWHPPDLDWKPDLIIVELGGNDIRRGASPEALKRDLEGWITTLQPSGAKILLIAVPGALLNDPYADVWPGLAKEYPQISYMPSSALRSVFGKPSYTLADGIHFTKEGHAYFAGLVADRIRGK